MSKKHQKQTFRALGWTENEKFHASEPSDEQKTPKTNFPSPRMDRNHEKQTFRALGEAKPATGFIEKRKKLRIPWTESSKNGKNCEFRGQNRQKTGKTANSVDGIVKKRRKLQIPWTESAKIGENRKFRGQNQRKTAKTANSVGRISEKRQKLQIPWAESAKNGENNVSPPWGK